MNFKTIAIMFTLLTLVSCGKDLRRAIGADYNNKIREIDNTIKDHEQRLKNLESVVSQGVSDMADIEAELANLAAGQTALATSLVSAQNTLQSQLNDAVSDIAVLKGYENIVEFYDPCGDGAGYDEIILKTSSGKLIAYFEIGSKRFLTVLTDGSYRTTDSQECVFTVLNGEIL
jgi:hypothetical protein